jgi:FlaA1/EpsC-like NDP-sugar epimerase
MKQTLNTLTLSLQRKLKWLYQNYSIPRFMVFILDNLAVFFVFLFAYLLRFNFVLKDFIPEVALVQAMMALGVYALFSLLFQSYAGLIRHTTIVDMLNVLFSTTSSFVFLVIISLVSRWESWNRYMVIPLSILLIHFFSITLLLYLVRFSIKIIYHILTNSFMKNKRVLVFGAGEMGVIVKRVIQSDVKSTYQVAGFIDDNKKLQGKWLNAIKVYSPKALTSSFIRKNRINVLIFAVNALSPDRKSSIMKLSLELGLEVLEAPAVETWLNGQFHVSQIEKVKLEDLLGRDPIHLNLDQIGSMLTGKVILVTGAAGSIGSEIVRQLARFYIRNLVLVDQSETPIFHLENELRYKFSHCPVELILTDVTNVSSMERIFENYHPEIVFHAAAYKHVPVMEENPHEAMRVNVGGTLIITRLSMRYKVEKFVMISTDKAVNPTNVMGASKRICEMIVQYRNQLRGNSTQFIITRFGNVLGSNGSVIEIFRKQIENGGPVTVTHPDVTRYFMTIPEACQLVLEAGLMGKGGEIFVFDMGKPMKIADLAVQMIRLSGLVPGKDIKIEYTGLRPGEKLYEELLAACETTKPTYHPKIRIAQVEKMDHQEILIRIEELICRLYSVSKQEVVDFFREFVMEYKSTNKKYIKQPLKVESIEIKN